MMRLAARAGFSFSPAVLNLRLAQPPKKQNAPYGAHHVALTSDPAGLAILFLSIPYASLNTLLTRRPRKLPNNPNQHPPQNPVIAAVMEQIVLVNFRAIAMIRS